MSDDEKTTPTGETPENANGGGQQPDGGQPETTGKDERTFTQSELDAIIADRLKREQQKYSDYDELQEAAEKWQKEQEKRKSAEERLQDKLAKVEKERDQAQAKAQETLIRSAFIMEASKHNAVHPGDAYALADHSDIAVGDNGDVEGVEEQVKLLVEDGRLPTAKEKQSPTNLDGGAGGKKRGGSPEPTEINEERIKAKYGI